MKKIIFTIGLMLIGLIMLGIYQSLHEMNAGRLHVCECMGVLALSYFTRLIFAYSGIKNKCKNSGRVITGLIFCFIVTAKCVHLTNSIDNMLLLATSFIVFIVGEILFETIIDNLDENNQKDESEKKNEN